MALNFDANQYEGVFIPRKIQNWEVPKKYKGSTWFNDHYTAVRPNCHGGFTEIIANDRGHICENELKSGENPWGNFVGTWDLPKKIPGTRVNITTARRDAAQDKLRRQAKDATLVMSGSAKNSARQSKPQPVDVPAAAEPSNLLTAEAMPASAEVRRTGAEGPTPVEPAQASASPAAPPEQV